MLRSYFIPSITNSMLMSTSKILMCIVYILPHVFTSQFWNPRKISQVSASMGWIGVCVCCIRANLNRKSSAISHIDIHNRWCIISYIPAENCCCFSQPTNFACSLYFAIAEKGSCNCSAKYRINVAFELQIFCRYQWIRWPGSVLYAAGSISLVKQFLFF